MNAVDWECSYFDVPTNFLCGALPGAPCEWPDGLGGRVPREDFHPERIEAAAAIAEGPGDTPTAAEFDRAVEAAIGDKL